MSTATPDPRPSGSFVSLLTRLRYALRRRFLSWALRQREMQPGVITITQNRLYTLPTAAGLVYALALLVIFLAAINYNLGLGHLLVFLLIGVAFVTLFHSARNLLHLRIAPGPCPPVFAGEIAHFTIHLENIRQTPRPGIHIALLDARGEIGEEEWVDIPAQGQCDVRLGVVAQCRGWLALPRIQLRTCWPLGLIRAWSYGAPDMRCLIYPRPASSAPSLPWAGQNSSGSRQSQEGDEDFSSLRRHRPGEPLRQVAWKAAAKRGPQSPLLAKAFSGASPHLLWLDWQALPIHASLETRISIMTRWTLLADKEGGLWGVRLPDQRIAPGRGPQHLHSVLKTLALWGTTWGTT